MINYIPPSYVKLTKPTKKRTVRKEDGTKAKEDLEEEENCIKMEMYFHKYKQHAQAVVDWKICNKKIFILVLQH